MQTPSNVHSIRDPWLWLLIFSFGTMLATLSVLRYLGFNALMYDLGNMAQSIGSVQRGEPLVFTQGWGQLSRLGYHFELFYLLLALPYALWSDPRLLVVIEAILYALAALPVYALAVRRLESRLAGRLLALVYLLYPVAQTAVIHDMHGDTLGMPFLLFALDALDRRAWRWYALWIALALSCKFYVAAPVAALGLLVWWCYGERRVGMLTTLAGIGYGGMTFFVIRPLFYIPTDAEFNLQQNYFEYYFGNLESLIITIVPRIDSALVVLLPILFLLRHGGIWIIPALPIITAALVSTMIGSYSYTSHHYALAVPFLVMVIIDGLDRSRRDQGFFARYPGSATLPPPPPVEQRRRFYQLGFAVTLLITVIVNISRVDTPLNPNFWSGRPNYGLDSSVYGITSRDAVKRQFLAEQVPPDVPIAASLYSATHLTNRSILYLVRYGENQPSRPFADWLPKVDYIVPDALFDFRRASSEENFVGGAHFEQEEIALFLRDADFGLVAMRDGMLLFKRDSAPDMAMEQQFTILVDDGRAALAAFAGIELIEFEIEPLLERRYRAHFVWRATAEALPLPSAVAVSRLVGLDDTRIVHLPTYALIPTPEWEVGQMIHERFEFELPADAPAGEYRWKLGWYNLGHSEAYATDERSRIGAEYDLTTIELP